MVQAGIMVTPNLNRLAAQGATFSLAYNASPICVPARTALATGIYPTRNGVVFNDWQGSRAGDFKPIHQYLAEAGYTVAHIGIDHIKVNPPIRERVAFRTWIDNGDYAQYLTDLGLDDTPPEGMDPFKREVVEKQGDGRIRASYSNTHVAEWPFPAEHFKDSYFCRQAIDFLQEPHDQPFALFLYLWAPHPPLRVPEPYASRFAPEAIDLPNNVGIPAKGEPANRRQGMPAQLAEGISLAQWRAVWAAHLGLVNLADAEIGRILDLLDDTGLATNTVITFLSDHGDHLGQHAMYQKMEMYEQAIRTPLIIRVPGATPRVIPTPVSHLDLVPTLLDTANIPVPDDLDGISLHAAITDGRPLPNRPIFCQYSGNPTVGDIRRAVITERYKYIYDPTDVAELYDLETDPLEMENLADDSSFAEVVEELHTSGKAWAELHGDWVTFA